MKSMSFPQVVAVLVLAALAGAGGWYAGRHQSHRPPGGDPAEARSASVYTCSMHPQVRQPGPGTCPFCGMALAPLNSAGNTQLPAGSVMLSSNRVNAIHVQISPVRKAPLHRTLRVAGVIDDNDARHRFLSAYVAGRIDALHVNFVGAEVQAGQPLASIYSPALLAAEREYVALVRTAPAAIGEGQQAPLLAGARQRLIQLGIAPAQIDALTAKPETALQTELLAPMGGTVVNRMVYEGAYVMEGEKLFEIADFSTMWFRFDAYERDLAWLQAGQMVEVTAPSVPGRVFRAPISFIDPNLNDPTRSAKVRVELSNPLVETNGQARRLLLHRTYAEGLVHVVSPRVLTVPRSAVLAPGRPYVFVDRGAGIYEQRRVTLGRAGDDAWEVLAGLDEGENVVTTGNLLIDAQAELDRVVEGTAPAESNAVSGATSSAAEVWPALTAAEQLASTNYLRGVAAVTESLAADDLAEFGRRAAALFELGQALGAGLTNGSWTELAATVRAAPRIGPVQDLKAARKAFHPVSVAAAELALALRRHAAVDVVRVFQCPMVKQSFPGAPRIGRWIQVQADVRNPYFGAEMLDCGNEIKP